MELRRWYSISAAAEYFGLKSPKTLYSLIGRDRLPKGAVLRIGRQIRLNVAAIEADATLSGHGKGRRG
jgi:hypothetical protein